MIKGEEVNNIIAKKMGEKMPSKIVPRESDNPILEEYKEDLSHKPGYGIRPAGYDDERLLRLEELLGKVQERLADLEKRIKKLEEK